ncbi:VWA domain-containing protein [Ornithinibacillus halotolerans]|uniref:Chloride channel protein n=1 Tax=Ornithinibacillus halotolerans TaxID=1274357 RepID=A0A916RMP5_9BACI|nr:VWA domain-containing protein [Ornithinibacillus halotolerans]GGA61956.1 chloride channel protein [Ornithinibacillus halotolerans]
MGFQIDNPIFLLLFIPVLAVLYLYWKTITLRSKLEKRTILVVRFFIFSLIIIALCSPYLHFSVQGVTTVFVVDHSESVRNEQNKMYDAIEVAIEGMGENDTYAIITVAEEAQISQSVSTREKSIVSTSVPTKTSFTNLEEGLQVASSLLKTNGRIVLLTDGNENIGNVKDQVNVIKEKGIELDVMPFTTSISQDVALEEFIVPKNLFNGEMTTIQSTISSTVDTTSRIRISKNNEVIVDEEVSVKEGTNVYTFDYVVHSPGIHSFHAEISSEADSLSQNNVGYAISNVQGTPSVLIVEGAEGEANNISPILEASGLQVDRINPVTLPTSLSGLLDYETIIFSNVSATDVTLEQMELIESAVRDFGVGFIMTGGNQSYGLGGYFKTPIETVLPVEMDLKGKKELPSLGLIIVLDRSGSMAGYKMDLAKEAAARSVELLREKDTLGFIAFDDQPWQIIETAPLSDKEEAANNIRSVTEGGGTNIFPALQLAYEQLKPLDLKRKHIILLTDGQSATNNDYLSMIEEGLESNITLSTVAIGNDADRLLLEELATEGTGRYYDVQDASTIPSILSRETILTTRTYIEDNPFYPTYVESTEWSRIFNNGVPQMNVYVATDPKSRAEEILISDKGDPVLVRWQYGLGNTIAWTSDVRGEWAGDWPLWEKWVELWNEMLTWSLPTYQQEMFNIQQRINGKEITLQVTSENIDILPLEARIVDEKGKEIEAQIRPTAPGEHEVTFQADTGIYFLQLSKIEDDQITSTYQTGIVVPYSKEFELTVQNDSLLKEITYLSGGIIVENPEDVFRELEYYPTERQPIFSEILLIAFLLFFIEIYIRRFGLVSLAEKVKRKLNQTSNKENERKQEVEQTFSRLKKATSKEKGKFINTEPAPMVKQVKQEKEHKIERKKEQQVDQHNNKENVEDRMKRLLEAKNRKNK